jgi:predicted nucleic acid-binding protein
MRSRQRIVIDTNVLVSRLLAADSVPGEAVRAARRNGHLLVSDATMYELAEVLSRRKLNRYVTAQDRRHFLRQLSHGQLMGVLSQKCIDAFERIKGRDRDDFHHLNKGVATDREKLEKRAEECVSSLYEIETELFGFGIENGTLVPLQPQYWPRPNADKYIRVFLRSH